MPNRAKFYKSAGFWRKFSMIFLALLAISTFFAPAAWSRDFFAPFQIFRLIIFAIFLGFLFANYKKNDKKNDKNFDISAQKISRKNQPKSFKKSFKNSIKNFANSVKNSAKNAVENLKISIENAPKFARILMITIPILVIIFAILQAFFPDFAIWLVRCETQKECGLNYRHAIFLKSAFQLSAAVIFAILAVKFARKKQILATIFCAILILVLIMMTGEELSWGQRIFLWETPENFAILNAQKETNLHNLATDVFQNSLYFAGFLLLVFLPFFRQKISAFLQKFRKFSWLQNFLPPMYFLAIFGAAFALVDPYFAPTGARFGSIAFEIFATAAILVFLIVPSRGSLANRLCLALGAFIAAFFLNFFVVTATYDWNHGVPTEYLEVFINFGILLWAIFVLKNNFPRKKISQNKVREN